jgi:hypothetical protein
MWIVLVAAAAAFGGAGFEFAGFDFGEVDDGLGDVVGVVGEDVEGDVLDDLDDLRIVQSCNAASSPTRTCKPPASQD